MAPRGPKIPRIPDLGHSKGGVINATLANIVDVYIQPMRRSDIHRELIEAMPVRD